MIAFRHYQWTPIALTLTGMIVVALVILTAGFFRRDKAYRSAERRVGKECRSRRSPYH